jgi:ribosome production factor 2
MSQFKGQKFAIGQRPMMVFAGTAFESPVANEWTVAKSLLLDFFRGEPSDKVDVEGLTYVVVVTADEPPSGGVVGTTAVVNKDDPGSQPGLHLRVYLIRTKRSGHRLPRVEVEEQGPRMDFRLGRVRQPDEAMFKEAMRKAKTTEERTKKNISTDVMGDKLGRIHLGRQDLSQLQTRKMKGLKRGRGDDASEDDEPLAVDDEPERKRKP